MRSLNERALNEHEQEERRLALIRIGLPGNEGVFQVEQTTVSGLGEGFRTLLWIWCRTTEITIDDNNLDMHEGK